MNHSKAFSDEAKRKMQAKGISGNEMARKVNVAPSTMCGYLNAQRAWPLDKAVECADLLASDVTTMIGRDQ